MKIPFLAHTLLDAPVMSGLGPILNVPMPYENRDAVTTEIVRSLAVLN
jgi:hypothetical protein